MQIFIDRAFRVAILFSLFSHGLLFLKFSGNNFLTEKNDRPALEVTYVEPGLVSRRQDLDPQLRAREHIKKEKSRREIPSEKEIKLAGIKMEPPQERVEAPRADNHHGEGRQAAGENPVGEPEVAAAPSEPSSAPGNVYLGYFQELRELIRRSVRCPRPLQEGEVYLRFVVSRDGRLIDAPLIDKEKSTSLISLQEAARRGIIDASPFPPFPGVLRSARITFEVPIFFREGQ